MTLKLQDQNILITGGAGFVGSHLSDQLCATNNVIILDNLLYGSKDNLKHNEKYTFLEEDVTTADFDKILRQYEIDYVFHLATYHLSDGLTNPIKDLEIGGLGGIRLLDAVKKYGKVKRFIFTSTGSVYGEPQESHHDENHPLLPTTAYGISKTAMDNYCRIYHDNYGVKTVRLRYYNIFGTRRLAGAIPQFILKALNNQPITIEGGDQVRTPTFVSDVVEATLLAATSEEAIGQAYNIAAKESISVKELALLIIRLCGKEEIYKQSNLIKYTDYRPGEIITLIPSVEKVAKQLGWKSRKSIDEGLKIVIEDLMKKPELILN